jgi:hypothetical protein
MSSTVVEDVLSANHHSGSWKIKSMSFFNPKTFVFQLISTMKHPTNTLITPRTNLSIY